MLQLRDTTLRRAMAVAALVVISAPMASAQSSRARYCDDLGTSLFDRGDYSIQGAPADNYGPTSDYGSGSTPSGAGSSSLGGNAPGGGLGDLSIGAGSTPGDSFAALAPGSYIDSAIVADMFRYRFDAAYNNPLPDRAEFFYGQCGCFGGNAPGPLNPETSVDYQEFTPYLERALTRDLSLFVETPVRLINPDINDNTGGMGDINMGFKASLYSCNRQYLTAQFRVFAPTGDADRGLGTGHASLEPGVLYLGQWNDRLIVQSEFRAWIPLSDSAVAGRGDFAGTILRYGVGGGYDLLVLDSCCQRRRLTGTLETVGWSILDGLAFGGANNPVVLDADGDTIVNIKSGLRYTAGRQSLASTYGVAVSNDRWYSDIVRLEYRYAY